MKRTLLLAVGALIAATFGLHAAGLFNGYPEGNGPSYCGSYNTAGVPGTTAQCTSTVPAGPTLTGNELVPADTSTLGAIGGSGAAPPTILIPSATLAGLTYSNPRNLLGNSSLLGTQVNGTNAVTGATTSAPTSAALGADRWVIDTNVGSGTGKSQIVTSSPSPPTGFTQTMKVWRNSAALTQPVCAWQAIPSPQSTQLAGQQVAFSVYAAALAGLAADNGGVINLVIISGTGTDQGLGGVSWTASPAITPAWTGVATAVNTPINVTTTFARYYTTATIPATATEVGVAICFTPTATGSGATDGFAFVGAQLERAPVPSLYEVRPRQTEIIDNLQFVYSIQEGSALVSRAVCHVTTAASGGAGDMQCPIVFPVPMYKAPTMAYTAGFAGFTTTAETTATVCSALATDATITFVPSTQQVMVQCALTSSTIAVGLSMTLADDSGSGVITAWSGM